MRLATDPTTCLTVGGLHAHAGLGINHCSDALWRYDFMTFSASLVEGTW